MVLELLPTKSSIFFPFPLSRTQLRVAQKTKFNRRRASPELEKRAEAIWTKRTKENPHLFNGTKFRYAGMSVATGGEIVTEQNLKLVIPGRVNANTVRSGARSNANLGAVSTRSNANLGAVMIELQSGFSNYKEYTTTNMGLLAEEFAKYGTDKYNDAQACMGDIIGHSALLLTSDNFVVIQLRSQTVGEGVGMWHFPGGHPEPEDVGIMTNSDLEQTDQGKIVDEIYESVLREMKEELNMSEDAMDDPVLLSVGKDKETFYKPEFNFVLRTQLTAAQVSERYHAEDFDDPESDDIGFWDVSQLCLSDKLCFELYKFKSDKKEVVLISVEQLANSSLQLIDGLQTVLRYNPKLFQ